jgi:uncharacterized repeat protein (TIGR03803 family)
VVSFVFEHVTKAVIIGHGGVLYGTTEGGGTSNNGTVFSLTPPGSPGASWTETALYSFAGAPNDGANDNQRSREALENSIRRVMDYQYD